MDDKADNLCEDNSADVLIEVIADLRRNVRELQYIINQTRLEVHSLRVEVQTREDQVLTPSALEKIYKYVTGRLVRGLRLGHE